MGWYLKLIEVCNLYISWFKFVDLALDVKINTDYVIREVFLPEAVHKKKTFDPIAKKWSYETLYIGNRDLKKNTWKLIRIYNKVIDTQVKDKEFLYNMETMGKDLTRIEIRLLRDKCKHFRVEYLQDQDKLYEIFGHEVFEIHRQFFKHIHSEDVVKLKNSYFIDLFKGTDGGFLSMGHNLTKGVAKANLEEKIKRFETYGNSFKDDKAVERAKATILTYYKRLRGSGHITKEGFIEWIEGLELSYETQTMENGIII